MILSHGFKHLKKRRKGLRSLTCTLFVLALLAQSCRRDNTPPEPAVRTAMAVRFSKSTIPFSRVDSVWLKAESIDGKERLSLQLQKGKDEFFLPLNKARTGDWKQELIVYSTEDRKSSRRYVRERSAPLSGNQVAPVTRMADPWKPYIVLTDNGAGIGLVIAERPEDPYFEIISPPGSRWSYVYLDRLAINQKNEAVNAVAWECPETSVITGRYINTGALSIFARDMKNLNWSTGDLFLVLAGEHEAESRQLYYSYPNRYTN
jgi:hypothetical protein